MFLPDFVVSCACRNYFCHGADITEDGIVDLFDLIKIASDWLKPMNDVKEENSLNQIVDGAGSSG